MAFGPIMQLNVGELAIELAPLTKESAAAFVSPGMQQASITRYLSVFGALTIEDELEWYDKIRTDKTVMLWGIWHIEDKKRTLIGNTVIEAIERDQVSQATTGSVITDKAYWGKGIASALHKARTWYAFKHLGLMRLKSAVIQGNVASKKALEKSGYTGVYVERNTTFGDGKLRHQDNLECLSPLEAAWNVWWGDDKPTATALAARDKTIQAMEWAEEHVTLL